MNSTKRGIPIEVCDEHNEAFYLWHKARLEGHLSRPLDLFHVDAHDDMGRPERLIRSIYFSRSTDEDYAEYYRSIAHESLSIANFILPAVLNRLVRNIYFIPPAWRKMKPLRKRLNISTAFGEGVVIKHNLLVDHTSDARVNKAYPDLIQFGYYIRTLPGLPRERHVILDIDLDYFACVDSITNYMSYDLEITKRQYQNKELFISKNKTIPYGSFDFEFLERDGKYYARISHKKVRDLAHLPNRETIKAEIAHLVGTLQQKGIRPAVVTICRSCVSGFCPREYQEFIETALIERLHSWLTSLV